MNDEKEFPDDEEFSLVEPFYVDNGELDGMSLQQAFVLGYEFSSIIHALGAGVFPVEIQFHSENENRVRKMLDRHKARYEVLAHDDFPLLVINRK